MCGGGGGEFTAGLTDVPNSGRIEAARSIDHAQDRLGQIQTLGEFPEQLLEGVCRTNGAYLSQHVFKHHDLLPHPAPNTLFCRNPLPLIYRRISSCNFVIEDFALAIGCRMVRICFFGIRIQLENSPRLRLCAVLMRMVDILLVHVVFGPRIARCGFMPGQGVGC